VSSSRKSNQLLTAKGKASSEPKATERQRTEGEEFQQNVGYSTTILTRVAQELSLSNSLMTLRGKGVVAANRKAQNHSSETYNDMMILLECAVRLFVLDLT
jgi:hypothetical protein